MVTRRKFLKTSALAGAASMMPWGTIRKAFAIPPALSNPAAQPKFVNLVPDALAPGFKILTPKSNDRRLKVFAGPAEQETGLINPGTGTKLKTAVWGYGKNKDQPTWPGPTIEAKSGKRVEIRWENGLGNQHLLPVDTNLHWAYSLHGYQQYTIANDGVPIVTHLHGGHSDFQFDGNPEFFFSPGFAIRGPQFVEKTYIYDNDQPAGNLWYHDHALGITRLNVYAGLAGFYFLRDKIDTGDNKNKLGLPAWPYEKAYAIQDRMFTVDGALFYPAYPGDPAYDDFITGEGVTLGPPEFPDNPNNEPGFNGGGPTALAEFFGDHMVVNGLIWPKEDVEPRNYRLHLLNGTDSRFMAIRFRVAGNAADTPTTIPEGADTLPFWVVGSDQGLASEATEITDYLLVEPGSRYDIVVNFGASGLNGKRIIMENIGGDEPFGGDVPGPQIFSATDRIMAFDVTLDRDWSVPDSFNGDTFATGYTGVAGNGPTRKVALFEGKDEFGRLQPLLGTAEPATDYAGNDIDWPATPEYEQAVLPDGTPSPLIGQMEGSIAWHSPTTENPALNTTEEWEVWNVTGDAHPVHLHLVHFEILGRQEIKWDSHTTEDDRVIPNDSYNTPAGDGTYLVVQPTVQHNSVAGDPTTYGMGFKIMNKTYGLAVPQPEGYVENAPKDMVTALPDQITRIRAKFDKPGRYVWHCHILSHEDHEMMRVLHVGPGA